MVLVRLACRNFRSLSDLEFEPSPGLNAVCGANAEGKTSLLEAFFYAATSKSHRTSQDADLVQYGSEGFRVDALVRRGDRDVRLEVSWWQGVKRLKVNGVLQKRFSDLLGKVNVVFCSPEDVDLVRGTAAFRRRFLDMELSQLHPDYLKALQQYREVLRQRNELLRDDAPDPCLLEVWEEHLGRYGKVLIRERRDFVQDLSPLTAAAYEAIAGAEKLELRYHPDVAEEEALPDVLVASRRSDARRGLTSRGPHRDDVCLFVDGQPARRFGSQGQQKTAALALKLAEWELVRDRTSEYPILMIDDVTSELDAGRLERLFDVLPQWGQCLVTATDLGRNGGGAGAHWTRFVIERGRLAKQ